MHFIFSSEQLVMKKLFADFAEKEVKPLAAEIDMIERFPAETLAKLKRSGMLGLPFLKKYGGMGHDTLTAILLVEELSKVCGSTGVIVSSHMFLCADALNRFGTEEQKQKYLVPLAKGDLLGAFGLTEWNAGTDAAGQKCSAVLQGGYYRLNGTKIFVTNAGQADIYIVFAVTDPSKGPKGISAFIVEKTFPGFSVGKIFSKMGIRGSAAGELLLSDCRVPEENRLGEEGKGLHIALGILDGGRIGIAAQALGIAEGAFKETVQYVMEREQFGKAIAAFQYTQFKLADIKTRIQAAKLLVYQAARTKDSGQRFSEEAAMAKLFASETAMDVTTQCLQLFGGHGYIKGCPAERMMRDAKITEIYEGTSEVQRMVIWNSIQKQAVETD